MSFLQDYYRDSYGRETRDELKLAVESVRGDRTAIDCGCGAGSDIEFLLSKGFEVHAFDVEQAAINLCKKRFKATVGLSLTRSSFVDYQYPLNSLTVADSSLFFCDESNLSQVWHRISTALRPSGVFCGSFLGPKDKMHEPDSLEKQRWNSTLSMEETDVRRLFRHYEILHFQEHRIKADVKLVDRVHWHIFSVVARKMISK